MTISMALKYCGGAGFRSPTSSILKLASRTLIFCRIITMSIPMQPARLRRRTSVGLHPHWALPSNSISYPGSVEPTKMRSLSHLRDVFVIGLIFSL